MEGEDMLRLWDGFMGGADDVALWPWLPAFMKLMALVVLLAEASLSLVLLSRRIRPFAYVDKMCGATPHPRASAQPDEEE